MGKVRECRIEGLVIAEKARCAVVSQAPFGQVSRANLASRQSRVGSARWSAGRRPSRGEVRGAFYGEADARTSTKATARTEVDVTADRAVGGHQPHNGGRAGRRRGHHPTW